MDLRDFIAAIARYWRAFVAVTGVMFGIGAAWIALTPTTYASTTQLMVSVSGSTTAAAYQNDEVVAGRVNSYIALLSSQVVSQRVIDKLRLPMTASQLVHEISATNVPPRTAVIDVSVTDTSPARAQLMADTLAAEFISYVDALETPTGEDGQKMHITVVSPASQPGGRRAERAVFGILVAVLAVLFGAVAVWIRSRTDPVLRTPDRAGAATGVPVIGCVTPALTAAAGDLEEYRRLRIRLRSNLINGGQHADRGCVVILASPAGEVDTAAIALNLGRVMELAGIRSIVLRTDGSDVEGPARDPDEPSIQPGADGLPDHISVSGWARDPDLATKRSARLFDRLRTDYDYVIVAAPPVRETLTASVLGNDADGVVLVVAADETRRREAVQSADSLRATGAPLTGVLFASAGPKSTNSLREESSANDSLSGTKRTRYLHIRPIGD